MAVSLDGRLVVALSSRALFDFEEENQLFEAQNDRAYMKLQLARLDVPARPGIAFPLVQKLLAFNQGDTPRVEVVLLSRNDPVSGLRAFRSAAHHGLQLERGMFTRGRPPFGYLDALGAHLFLSMNGDDVRAALDAADPGDIVVVAGKGHETTQIIGTQVRPFDDAAAVREALVEAGHAPGTEGTR